MQICHTIRLSGNFHMEYARIPLVRQFAYGICEETATCATPVVASVVAGYGVMPQLCPMFAVVLHYREQSQLRDTPSCRNFAPLAHRADPTARRYCAYRHELVQCPLYGTQVKLYACVPYNAPASDGYSLPGRHFSAPSPLRACAAAAQSRPV